VKRRILASLSSGEKDLLIDDSVEEEAATEAT
jgi:hypothetical protein